MPNFISVDCLIAEIIAFKQTKSQRNTGYSAATPTAASNRHLQNVLEFSIEKQREIERVGKLCLE